MKKYFIAGILFLVVAVGGTFLYLQNAETTPISYHWEGYKTWYKSSGAMPITGDETRFLGGKHRGDEGYRVIFINEKGTKINKGQSPYNYPEGTVIVKEQYKSKVQFEKGSKPDINVMIKLAKGASPETDDWGYVTGFRRTIHKGKSSDAKFCGGCHKSANLKKGDNVFVNSRTFPLK